MTAGVPAEMPGEVTAQADDELWSAIADPSRRQVLDLFQPEVAVRQ